MLFIILLISFVLVVNFFVSWLHAVDFKAGYSSGFAKHSIVISPDVISYTNMCISVYKDTQHDIILSAVTCSLLPYSVRGVDNDW